MNPKVTVIMPSAMRSDLLERAVAIYHSQDYHNKELIIYESSARHVSLETEGAVMHYKTISKPTVGEARNLAIARAKGDIIVHQDDDDIYAPDWISRSVGMLIESGAGMVGMKDAYFYKPDTEELWFYENKAPDKQHVLLGATMCYWRKAWEDAKYNISYDRVGQGFRHINRGEDVYFCDHVEQVAVHNYHDGFCAIRHSRNVNNDTRHPFFKKQPFNKAQAILAHYERYTQG